VCAYLCVLIQHISNKNQYAGVYATQVFLTSAHTFTNTLAAGYAHALEIICLSRQFFLAWEIHFLTEQ